MSMETTNQTVIGTALKASGGVNYEVVLDIIDAFDEYYIEKTGTSIYDFITEQDIYHEYVHAYINDYHEVESFIKRLVKEHGSTKNTKLIKDCMDNAMSNFDIRYHEDTEAVFEYLNHLEQLCIDYMDLYNVHFEIKDAGGYITNNRYVTLEVNVILSRNIPIDSKYNLRDYAGAYSRFGRIGDIPYAIYLAAIDTFGIYYDTTVPDDIEEAYDYLVSLSDEYDENLPSYEVFESMVKKYLGRINLETKYLENLIKDMKFV